MNFIVLVNVYHIGLKNSIVGHHCQASGRWWGSFCLFINISFFLNRQAQSTRQPQMLALASPAWLFCLKATLVLESLFCCCVCSWFICISSLLRISQHISSGKKKEGRKWPFSKNMEADALMWLCWPAFISILGMSTLREGMCRWLLGVWYLCRSHLTHLTLCHTQQASRLLSFYWTFMWWVYKDNKRSHNNYRNLVQPLIILFLEI